MMAVLILMRKGKEIRVSVASCTKHVGVFEKFTFNYLNMNKREYLALKLISSNCHIPYTHTKDKHQLPHVYN